MIQTDPTRPWKLCPHPERWKCADPCTAELEVYSFLTALVHLIKPEVIVETGTYHGATARALADGCKLNGFGHVWTYDNNPDYSIADLTGEWITFRNRDATTTEWDGPPIELFYCDGGNQRDKEILNFAPHFALRCIVVAHDAADMDYGWRNLEGLFVPIILPCARGLFIMRKV